MTSRVLQAGNPRNQRWQNAIRRAEQHAITVRHLAGEMWQADSASRPGASYVVTVRDGEPVRCTCAGSYGENVCQHRAAVWLRVQREAGQGELPGMVGV